MNRALANSRRQTDRLAVLQQQASTGSRLLNPSDDPLDTVAVLGAKAQDQRLDAYLGNIRDARSALDVSGSSLTEANRILTKARDLALEGANGTNEGIAFEGLAQL